MMKQRTVIFVITNGAGLGHLTRGLAIAKRLRAINIQSVFFTTSLATELIRKEGFIYFYIPTKSLFPQEVTMSWWVDFMSKQLDEVIKIYNPLWVVYEGVLPSSGVSMEIKKYHHIKSIWIKRENYKPGWQELDALEHHFDLIIVPKEVGENYIGMLEKSQKRYCNPIILLDEEEAYSREVVRTRLGVKKDEKLYYVQLSIGGNMELQKMLIPIQKSLLKRQKTKLIIGESLLDRPVTIIDKNIRVVKIYPSSSYFKGIDFAIAAAGYNTFHELVKFKVPTLFIPNKDTVVDNQVKRVENLEVQHAVLQLKKLEELDLKINLLEKHQRQIIRSLKAYEKPNGAIEAAKIIADILGE